MNYPQNSGAEHNKCLFSHSFYGQELESACLDWVILTWSLLRDCSQDTKLGVGVSAVSSKGLVGAKGSPSKLTLLAVPGDLGSSQAIGQKSYAPWHVAPQGIMAAGFRE